MFAALHDITITVHFEITINMNYNAIRVYEKTLYNVNCVLDYW